ncbi:MAG: S8 family peptidase [Clostridium sp.]|uniref:S8 family peptidase n=1 Tax=Clostridium sp. TaxID=1506 RepID=UPI0030554A7C
MNTTELNSQQEPDCRDFYIDDNYFNILVQYDEDLTLLLKEIDYACAYKFAESSYIVSINASNYEDFFIKFGNVLSLDVSYPYTLSSIQPVDAANITKFHGNSYLGLTGKGTVVGIIDTGIDYMNPQFINDDNTSRILAIWDQSIQSPIPASSIAFYGSIYTQSQINDAINASLNGKSPYDIVPSKDLIGHGTNVAGLVGAKGLNGVVGGAPNCEFIIVKLKEAKGINLSLIGINDRMDTNIYEGIDIYMAIQFLVDYQAKINKPMSIVLSCGTNWGGHEGRSSIERDIDYFSSRTGLIFVTNTGNQGTSETHASGKLFKTNDINSVALYVAPNEKNLVVMLWVPKPDKFSLSLVSPGGELVQPIESQLKAGSSETFNLVFGNSKITIAYSLSEYATGDESVYTIINNPTEGLWQIRIQGDYVVNGNYNMWIPQRPLIKTDTRFINSDPYITIQVPGNSQKAITTSFYNQNNNTIDIISGRGYTTDNRIKPNLTTGGVNALTIGLDNKNVVISGGSVAGAVLCSATLLLLEWGIVRRNDSTMRSSSIISYLTRGTNTRPGDIYPNPEWGYGMLNLQGSFENLRSLSLPRSYNCESIPPENLLPCKSYIKVPKEIYNHLKDI